MKYKYVVHSYNPVNDYVTENRLKASLEARDMYDFMYIEVFNANGRALALFNNLELFDQMSQFIGDEPGTDSSCSI